MDSPQNGPTEKTHIVAKSEVRNVRISFVVVVYLLTCTRLFDNTSVSSTKTSCRIMLITLSWNFDSASNCQFKSSGHQIVGAQQTEYSENIK